MIDKTREFESLFSHFQEKMRSADMPEALIRQFGQAFAELLRGGEGLIRRNEFDLIEDLRSLESLARYEETGKAALHRAVVIRLNGGLGTSMGLEKAKSLIRVVDDLRFIDIIIRHVLYINAEHKADMPLVFMNSYSTEADTQKVLEGYAGLSKRLPWSFLQHRIPKILADSFLPASWPDNEELEWCPPGHGDIFLALQTSGTLDALLAAGCEYAFIANSDNLGAAMDFGILGYMAAEGIPFLMEVTRRTESDRKGGHLARRRDGKLMLREFSQCPEEERAEFQDVGVYKYFNTNNIWINLPALKELLAANDCILPLPLIKNRKTLDPRDPSSPAVFQLETAMGAAVSLFDRAAAIDVPRLRFAPVKATGDLLALRSDAYVVTEACRVVPNPARQAKNCIVTLDDNYYKFIDQLEVRFPYGAPSLRDCESLTIRGDVRFGRNVVLRGHVAMNNPGPEPLIIQDDAVLENPNARM